MRSLPLLCKLSPLWRMGLAGSGGRAHKEHSFPKLPHYITIRTQKERAASALPLLIAGSCRPRRSVKVSCRMYRCQNSGFIWLEDIKSLRPFGALALAFLAAYVGEERRCMRERFPANYFKLRMSEEVKLKVSGLDVCPVCFIPSGSLWTFRSASDPQMHVFTAGITGECCKSIKVEAGGVRGGWSASFVYFTSTCVNNLNNGLRENRMRWEKSLWFGHFLFFVVASRQTLEHSCALSPLGHVYVIYVSPWWQHLDN